MATLAPNWAKRTAIAWPMPELPPVTRTFLPARPGMPSVGETVGAAVDMGAFSLGGRWLPPLVRRGAGPLHRGWGRTVLVQTKLHARPGPARSSQRAATVSRSASRLVYLGFQPSSRLALLASMIDGWLSGSAHSITGGTKRGSGTAAMARAAAWTGAPGTRIGVRPSSRASSGPVTTPSPVML